MGIKFNTHYFKKTGGIVIKGVTPPLQLPYTPAKNALIATAKAYYTFEEASGTTVYDVIGNHPATFRNPVRGVGKIGQAAVFTGSNYMTANDGFTAAYGTGARTIAFWIKSSQNGGLRCALGIGSGAAQGNNFNIYTETPYGIPGINVDLYGGAMAWGSAATVLNNAWHHVVIAVPGNAVGTAIQCYIDGALKTPSGTTNLGVNTVGTSGATAYPMMLGAQASAGGTAIGANPFTGSLDEVGFWNYQLTAANVQTLYNGGLGLNVSSA